MEATPGIKTVKDLLDLFKAKMLLANPEYQRGVVWTAPQKKRLVDSVLRRYPIPLIYLHHIKKEVAGIVQEGFEIIDGQQRINALFEFSEGAFKLFDPVGDEEEARFPAFIKDQPCPWGGKSFDDLDDSHKKEFLGIQLSVVLVQTDIANEARDLFIRLQAGMPLNPQEKRDAWPGSFTEFVLKVGGKPQIAKYPGHDFFRELVKPKERDRGDTRTLAAQMLMLFLTRRESVGRFCDIKNEAIDTFYYRHLSFDPSSPDARRFSEALQIVTRLLNDGKRKRLMGHEAMHLSLLVDSLLDEYTRSWEKSLALAFDLFRVKLAEAKIRKDEPTPPEFWTRYGVLTRVSTDRADTIQRRHQFFLEKMHPLLKLEIKDPARAFGILERELIYARDKKLCQVPGCEVEVLWADAEIHHVKEHSKGGATTLPNGALVHKSCHPKGVAATEAFAAHWGKLHGATGSMS